MWKLVRPLVSVYRLVLFVLEVYCSFIHRSILLLSLLITLVRSQSMTWLREMVWSATANWFCSVVDHAISVNHVVDGTTPR